MKKRALFFTISMVITGLLYAGNLNSTYRVNGSYHGFRLVEKRFVQEVNAECLYFVHEQSGARLMKIAADDPNKLFNIGFKTIPENSTGVAHILEHSVLNGSRSFPVKSPFTVLTQGSLNTFLNAMTGADFTTYPVASLNDKDYFNLMHVYLDAVLFPRIYDDPRIFLQEGWHYELDSIDGELVYKGVVFNEMKGAYSSPTRELFYQVNKVLFPANTYGVCSGGYPTEIPELSFEEFKEFHSTFYHPSNSYITLYGDANLDEELKFINEKYLSEFKRQDPIAPMEKQQPFSAMKEVQKPYAVAEGSPVEDNTYLSLNFVAGEGVDANLRMAMDVFANAFVNHQSSPLRLALQKANLGKNVSAGLITGEQNLFIILLQNANASEMEQFKQVVFQTMHQVLEEGFEREMLEGIINRNEFALREGNTSNKGMMYMMNAYLDWYFKDDPFSGLEFEAPLAYVKQALDTPLLEGIIRDYLIDNPHSLLMALYPQPGLESINASKEREKLAAYKASLSQEQLQQIVDQTLELREYQLREDAPEDLATIPMLSLQDISPEITWYDINEKSHNDVPVFHYDAFTNDILYSHFYFDMRVLPQELIPYARLLSTIMRQLGTDSRSFGDMENDLNINTGSFYTHLETHRQNGSEDEFLPFFVAAGKATTPKAGTFLDLASQVINSFSLEDQERLKTVVLRHQAAVENQMNNDGVNVAIQRLNSYYSQRGMFNELTNGLTYYQFITRVSNDFDENADDLVEKLRHTANLLFTRENLRVQVTCADTDYPEFTSHLDTFVASLPSRPATQQQWVLEPAIANEAVLSPSQVQYVVQGYDFKKLGFKYDGRMRVLNQILSRVYLQNTIRVMGGAYGGWAAIENTGNIYFASYRDPNLKETLENYKGGLSFLENFEADETEMTRYIIGTISNIDRPRTVSSQGQLAFSYLMENRKPEDLRAERAAILATTSDDIRKMSPLIGGMLSKNAYCVYGSENKVKENEALFNKIISIVE